MVKQSSFFPASLATEMREREKSRDQNSSRERSMSKSREKDQESNFGLELVKKLEEKIFCEGVVVGAISVDFCDVSCR